MNNQSKVCIAGKNEIAVFGLHFLVKKLGKERLPIISEAFAQDKVFIDLTRKIKSFEVREL